MQTSMNRQYVAVLVMMMGALFASLLSIVSLVSRDVAPFTMLTFSGLLAALVHIPFIYKRKGGIKDDKNFVWLSIAGGLLVTLGYAIFTIAIRNADNPFIPTVIFEMYPIGIIILSNFLLNREKISFLNYFWLAISIIGVSFVMIDNASGNITLQLDQVTGSSILSVGLLSLGAVVISRAFKGRESGLRHAILASFYARLGGIAVTIILALFEGFPIGQVMDGWLYVVLYGVLILGLTNVCYYGAIYLSNTHLINNVWYLTPVLGLIWLWIFSYGQFTNLIAVGATFIITSNLMLNLTQESRSSYSITICSIVMFGIIILSSTGLDEKYYFSAVSTPVIFFALLFGFVVDRMVKRLSAEQHLLLKLLNDPKNKDEKIMDSILKISQENNLTKIRTIYYDLIKIRDNEGLDEKIDELVLSKTYSINVGELFVIILTGALAIFTAIMYRPKGLLYDSFALIVSSSLIYLIMLIFDLHSDRRHNIFSRRVNEGLEARGFNDVVISRSALQEPDNGEKLLIGAYLFLLISTYIVMFYFKHY